MECEVDRATREVAGNFDPRVVSVFAALGCLGRIGDERDFAAPSSDRVNPLVVRALILDQRGAEGEPVKIVVPIGGWRERIDPMKLSQRDLTLHP